MNAIAEPATPVQAATNPDGLLSLRIRQIRYEAQGINSYELSCPHGGELPAFEAGAHIDVHIQPGLIRQYSLCNPPHERHRYVIAVLRDANGRGGSRTLHDA
ncbi:oxidoreductase, partial [Alcaligenes pakistanensis]